jgi:hypothetical protein
MFQVSVVEKIETNILVQQSFSEIRVGYEIMWKKYGTVRQATDGNLMRRIYFVCRITQATKKKHTHTPTIRNTYCFTTVTMVAQTGLHVIRTLPLSLSSKDILCCVDRASRYNRVKIN